MPRTTRAWLDLVPAAVAAALILTAFIAAPATARDARLSGLMVAPPSSAPYSRAADFGGWRKDNTSCLDTRGRALAAASTTPVTVSAPGRGHCTVLAGTWRDPYTGVTFGDPREVDVDHVVPLKEAWSSGADAWPQAARRAYANDLGDPGHLLVVSARANRAKGDKDPARWMPPDPGFRCAYVQDWIAIKTRWSLSADAAEIAALERILRGC